MKSLKEKVSKVGTKTGSDCTVKSFEGKVNSGPLKNYVEVDISAWMSVKQAKALIEVLEQHVQRIEVAEGAGVISGSHRLKSKPGLTKHAFIGYNEAQVSAFQDEVQALAKKRFLHYEHQYKWTEVEGQKTAIVLTFDVWQAALKRKTKGKL